MAGTINFVYLTKAEDNQYLGFSVYILASVLFLFTLREEEQAYTFQFEIIFYFLLLNIIFIVLFFLITEIKEEKLASIVENLKTRLYPGYLGALYLLCSHFHPDFHSESWIKTIIIQLALLFPLQYILETKEREQISSFFFGGSGKKPKDKDNEDKKAQSPLDQFSIVPFYPLPIGRLYFSFTNASFFLLTGKTSIGYSLFCALPFIQKIEKRQQIIFYWICKLGLGIFMNNELLEALKSFLPADGLAGASTPPTGLSVGDGASSSTEPLVPDLNFPPPEENPGLEIEKALYQRELAKIQERKDDLAEHILPIIEKQKEKVYNLFWDRDLSSREVPSPNEILEMVINRYASKGARNANKPNAPIDEFKHLKSWLTRAEKSAKNLGGGDMSIDNLILDILKEYFK